MKQELSLELTPSSGKLDKIKITLRVTTKSN